MLQKEVGQAELRYLTPPNLLLRRNSSQCGKSSESDEPSVQSSSAPMKKRCVK